MKKKTIEKQFQLKISLCPVFYAGMENQRNISIPKVLICASSMNGGVILWITILYNRRISSQLVGDKNYDYIAYYFLVLFLLATFTTIFLHRFLLHSFHLYFFHSISVLKFLTLLFFSLFFSLYLIYAFSVYLSLHFLS